MGRITTYVKSPKELEKYLVGYVQRSFHHLIIESSFFDHRGIFVFCNLKKGSRTLSVRLRLPANAPTKALPLFDSLYEDGELLWRYSVNYRPNVPWGEQHRVHLYALDEFHVLMHVVSGSPRDVITRTTNLSGTDLSPEVSALLKVQVARLWGMNTSITKPERRKLRELQLKGLPSRE